MTVSFSDGGVFGLWFYDDKECKRVAASLQKVINGMNSKSKTPSKRVPTATGENVSPMQKKSSSKPVVAQRNGQASILTMLTQAQQRYEEDRKRQHSPTSQSSPPQESSTGGKYIFSSADKSAPVIQLSNGNGKSIKILQKQKDLPDDSVVPTTAVSSSLPGNGIPFSPLSNRICPTQQPADTKSETGSQSPMSTVEESLSLVDSPFTPIKPDSPTSSSNNLSLTFASNLLTPELLTMSIADQQDSLLNSQEPSKGSESLLSPEALLGSHSLSTNSLPAMIGGCNSDPQRPESAGAMSPSAATGSNSAGSPVNSLLTRDQLRFAMISLIQVNNT